MDAPGSFWTQPKGEVHITAAKGPVNVAYIEIEDGPYLVRPVDQAFDSGERPANVDPSNLVWLDSEQPGIRTSYLWGVPTRGRLNGRLVEIRPGSTARLNHEGRLFRGTVVSGQVEVADAPSTAGPLPPGSLTDAKSAGQVTLTCRSDKTCVVYLRTDDGAAATR